MNKKDIKVKKSNGSNISITIENNLNANNKQINNAPKRRRRRAKKPDELQPTDIQPTDIQPSIPLKDTSYIKPGPVGAFKIWRNTMDSCFVCRHVSSKSALLRHFEWTSTTAHCSVHMPKHPSEKAGPSDRCAIPS